VSVFAVVLFIADLKIDYDIILAWHKIYISRVRLQSYSFLVEQQTKLL
jgi:hypothetical protein